MSERDPFQLLNALNPVPRLEKTKDSDTSLLADIIASPLPERPRRRRWWWIGTGVVVATVGATSYALLRSEPAKNPTSVVCYSNAAVPPDDQVALGAESDPVAACKQTWATGEFGRGDIPQLTACVSKSDMVAVIPGDDQVCGQLGYELWNGVIDKTAQAIVAFQDEITQTLGNTCYPEAQATTLTTEALASHGLSGWKLNSNNNWSASAPCTGIGIDPVAKTITLGSRPRFPTDKNP